MNSETERNDENWDRPPEEIPEYEAPAYETPEYEAPEPVGEPALEPAWAGAAPPETPPAPRSKAPLWAAIIGLVLLLVLVGVAFAIDLPGRLAGGVEKSAEAIPADAVVYMGINLLQANPENLDRILKPILSKVETSEYSDAAGMLAQLDQDLQGELGITFIDDIQPWLGQYASLGISNLQLDMYGGLSEVPNLVVAIETRNTGAADDFLEKLAGSAAEDNGEPLNEQEYQGVTIYTTPGDELAFARSGRLVLFAPSVEDIQSGIDAQAGESMADNDQLKSLEQKLAKDRLLTIFVDGAVYDDLLQNMASTGMLGSLAVTQSPFEALAMSLGIVDEGLRMDFVYAMNPELAAEGQSAALIGRLDTGQLAEVVPGDTMLLFASQELGKAFSNAQAGFPEDTRADFEESIQMLNQELGIDLQQDLLAYLDEEWGIAVMPGEATALGIPLGVVILSHINDQAALKVTLDSLAETFEQLGVTVTTATAGDSYTYGLGDPIMGNVLFIGLSPDYLVIGTGPEQVQAVLNPDGESLAETAEYKDVWEHFPRQQAPIVYLELAALLDYLQANMPQYDPAMVGDQVDILYAIPYAGMGGQILNDHEVQVTLIIFVEQPQE
jgi:hypothetical protein